jgi:hypothetical protein
MMAVSLWEEVERVPLNKEELPGFCVDDGTIH